MRLCGNGGSRKSLRYRASLQGEDRRVFAGTIHCIGKKGISVISDIDDTIKISNVLNKKEMIRNTFLRPSRAVSNMAPLYRQWKRQGAVFHYVSGSPWQLYNPLVKFLKGHRFPRGTVNLKNFRIKERSLFSFIYGDQKKYKTQAIEGIMNDYPGRKFVLVGDSGESDPEIYIAIAKKYPWQVRAIFIRDAGNLKERRGELQRLVRELRGVKWQFFENGSNLPLFL